MIKQEKPKAVWMQLLQREDLLLFMLIYHDKLSLHHIFAFWTVGQQFEDIHLNFVTGSIHCFLTFYTFIS